MSEKKYDSLEQCANDVASIEGRLKDAEDAHDKLDREYQKTVPPMDKTVTSLDTLRVRFQALAMLGGVLGLGGAAIAIFAYTSLGKLKGEYDELTKKVADMGTQVDEMPSFIAEAKSDFDAHAKATIEKITSEGEAEFAFVRDQDGKRVMVVTGVTSWSQSRQRGMQDGNRREIRSVPVNLPNKNRIQSVRYFASVQGSEHFSVYQTGIAESNPDEFLIGVALSNQGGEVSHFTPHTQVHWIALCTMK